MDLDASAGWVQETPERALPLLEIESYACALPGGEELAAELRAADPPVVARVQEGRVLLDCRTLADDEIDLVPVPG